MGFWSWFMGFLFGSSAARRQYRAEKQELKDEIRSERLAIEIEKLKLKEEKGNLRIKELEEEIKRLDAEKDRRLEELERETQLPGKAALAAVVSNLLKKIIQLEHEKEELERELANLAQHIVELDQQRLAALEAEASAERAIASTMTGGKAQTIIDQGVHGGAQIDRIRREAVAIRQDEAAEEALEHEVAVEESDAQRLINLMHSEEESLEKESAAEKRGDAAAGLEAEAEAVRDEKEEKEIEERLAA